MKLGRAYVESLFDQQTGLYTWVEVAGKRYYLRDVGPASVVDSSLFREGSDEAREKFYSNLGQGELPHVRSMIDVLPMQPGKILCVGLNYHDHAEEVGAELPQYPTVFTKFSNSLVGPDDPIAMPPESTKIDYEAELCVVIGRSVRRVNEEDALGAIAGYTLLNDVSVRDWQGRTSEWFQGKNWDYSTPFGPHIVSRDQVDPVQGLKIECLVDGEVMQSGTTANMIFTPAQIVSYLSTFMTLEPGDIIACGTPAGVGMSKKPRRFWLKAGHKVTVRVEGIGEITNECVPEPETVEHFKNKAWWGPGVASASRDGH
ncbi:MULTISPECIES: fumarylacetoacetate hydrolase family protein [Micrococcaceae]|uniref:fumarylacetoacetate hydrolase family protein n=1 Tax=unclassified Kocuria TaxID=2649579 RepID=UPI001011C1AB|nr:MULTISPECIES: fumarylacetoacetate hydrolase family protein [unclassified Kocuria]